jgi:hypothetical protein
MPVNIIGPKKKYKYTMDDGTVIKLRLDQTYGDLAACGLTPVTTADNAINKPSNFKPRVVFWQATAVPESDNEPAVGSVRRMLVCAPDSSAYTSVDNFSITIDGVAGQTTGRRGETISF